MTEKELMNQMIELINPMLNVKDWSIDELADGKKVELFAEWKPIVEKIIWKYRQVGWYIYWIKEKGQEYLLFENPKKKKFYE